jgi:hypothetical protein
VGEDSGLSLSFGMVLGQRGDPNAGAESEPNDLSAESGRNEDQGNPGADERVGEPRWNKRRNSVQKAMRSKIWRIVLLAALVAVILPIALWPQLCGLKKPRFLSPPNPNGYDTFVAAAKQLKGLDPRDLTNGYEAFVSNHSELFELFESGLKERAEAPARAYNAATMPVDDMMGLRRLGSAAEIKAKLAEDEKRWRDAALIYADVIQFGQKVENGPLINFLLGSAIELGAIKRVENLIPKLAENELKEVGTTILELNQSRPGFEQVMERERYFAVVNSGNILKLVEARFSGEMRKIRQSGEERYLNTEGYLEVVATSLAARRFSLQEHRPLRRIEELTPKYLATTPQDPYTGRSLILRGSETNLLIYSVGPNLKDDLGKKDDVAANFKDQVGFRIVTEGLSRMGDE